MNVKYTLLSFLFLLLAPASPIWAQDACPALVQNALEATGNACEGIGRNQICYGHNTVQLEPHDTSVNLPFNAPGDLASITEVKSIRLMSMDDLFSEWGVALMKLQANIPDTLPGENVTFVLFGDVEIRAAVPTNVESVTLTVTANEDTDIVAEPEAEPTVIGSLAAGDSLVADARSQGRNWLRVQLEGGEVGWVLADNVTLDGDFNLLDIIRNTTPPPLQAFYLRTGVGDARCGEAPGSGLLIQTPNGVGSINFTINNVSIRLMSSAYFQAQPNGDMTVSVLEGQVGVTLPEETTVWVPAGAQTVIPLDAEGAANGPAGEVVPYGDLGVLTATTALLPDAFELSPAISDAALEAYLDSPLYSTAAGNACVPGGVTFYRSDYNEPRGQYSVIVSFSHTTWTAKAGVKATFSVGGDISTEGSVGEEWGYISLRLPGGERFAGSGDATTWTYTFDEDMEFTPANSVFIPPGETGTTWMTISCEPPAS